MKRLFIIPLIAALSLSFALAETIYWPPGKHQVRACYEKRTGCELLQMVMQGSFAQFDPANNLDSRVFSALLPMLLEIEEEDAAHFCTEFSVSKDELLRAYYVAVGSCLQASLLRNSDSQDTARAAANILLSLFLDPSGIEDGEKKTQLIREQMDEADIQSIADAAQLPFGFVRHLMMEPDWRSAEKR